MTNWIAVSERLPEVGQRVLIWDPQSWGTGACAIGYYAGWGNWRDIEEPDAESRSVSHWMPLPEGPKET